MIVAIGLVDVVAIDVDDIGGGIISIGGGVSCWLVQRYIRMRCLRYGVAILL